MSPSDNPSIVVTALPSSSKAKVVQAVTGIPSTSTVQAPHTAWSQPDFAVKKLQILAQHVGQHPTRRDGEKVDAAVDRNGDLDCVGHAAAVKLRCSRTSIMRRR